MVRQFYRKFPGFSAEAVRKPRGSVAEEMAVFCGPLQLMALPEDAWGCLRTPQDAWGRLRTSETRLAEGWRKFCGRLAEVSLWVSCFETRLAEAWRKLSGRYVKMRRRLAEGWRKVRGSYFWVACFETRLAEAWRKLGGSYVIMRHRLAEGWRKLGGSYLYFILHLYAFWKEVFKISHMHTPDRLPLAEKYVTYHEYIWLTLKPS